MKNIVISQLGTTLDLGKSDKRWNKWRPNVAMCMQDDLQIDELHLLHSQTYNRLAHLLRDDIKEVSPKTKVILHTINHENPWDLEEMYTNLHEFCTNFEFEPEQNNYLFHITTGTHIAQICIFLLTEANYFPGKLLQTSPRKQNQKGSTSGAHTIIDLDLSKYDCIAQRFEKEIKDDISFLKSGINTKNKKFNQLMSQIEKVGMRSKEPILLTGSTGAGKSKLADRIYQLKLQKGQIKGRFVEVNCATLRGDSAMSTLFGHKKGAFTGAVEAREGLLKAADNGIIFLDEVSELGLDEQAMLLRAIEDKKFMPLGADYEATSNFQLICGTNRDLQSAVEEGKFREDLLARINIWSFKLPSLYERIEDIEPNLKFELNRVSGQFDKKISFNSEARSKFLKFAKSAKWQRNFRDFSAAITRLATLSERGRITDALVTDEISRLEQSWTIHSKSESIQLPDKVRDIDLFDQVQLQKVIEICKKSQSLADAGRTLFSQSRKNKKVTNDSDRLKKYLAKFNLTWSDIKQ